MMFEPLNHQPALWFTLVFCALLILNLGIKTWLASRHIKHVALNRPTVPAAFSAQVSQAAHHKAADYTLSKARFGLLDMAWSSAILLGWTLFGGLGAVNEWSIGVAQTLGWTSPNGIAVQLILLAGFMVISSLLELPVSAYQTFVIEQRFGFNTMNLQLWLTDLAKSTLIGAVVGLPIAALILWVMGATGAYWWLWAWGLWMGINLLLLLIYPTVIAPWFNKFKDLDDEALKLRVTALMQRCGFTSKGLYVMDGSRRSAHANAYFTGFGASKRVVFFDTLLQKLSPTEVEAVLAHELGHFKHKHIIKRLVTMFASSLLGFALLGWLAGQTWFYMGLGVVPNLGVPNDALALLLFVMVIPLFTFFISPVMSYFSRQHEFEADAYAKQQTNAQDLSSALLKLYEDNAATLTPDPVFVAFYYSHPPATQRLAKLQA
jgi:STE24 endopeptidase